MRKAFTVKKALIVIVAILLIVGGIYYMSPFIGGMKFKDAELRSCSVSTGGGMLGGYSSITLTRDDEGNAVLVVRNQQTHADREVTTVYQVDPAAFDHAKELAVKYDLYAASKRKYSDLIAYDADTTSVSFSFSNGSFRVSQDQVLSPKMTKGFREVESYLGSLAVGEGVTTIAPQKAILSLKSGYTIRFNIEDAFDGKLEAVLAEEHEVSNFDDCGIIMCTTDALDTSGVTEADGVTSVEAGAMVYDSEGRIILLYADHEFEQPVYVLARLEGHTSSIYPIIAEMTGPNSLYFNM